MRYRLTTLTPVPRLTRLDDGRECLCFSKQLAVLAYMTARPEAKATRDELVGLLWSGASQQDGRRALRQVVYQIRHATDSDLLRGESVLTLRREDIEADADIFRQRLAAGDLDDALAVYEQDFLATVALAGAREFEHWAEGVRALLAAERRQLLRTLIAREADAGRWTAGARLTEQLIAADPSSFDARLKLIELLSLSGDALTAQAAADETRALAAETTGEFPEPALEEAIGRALAPSTAPERRRRNGFPRNPEMVGRATQFRTVVERWKSAVEGKGGAVLLGGEAGIGKTRLARELARRFNQDRSLVLETACYALEQSDPLGPFLELLRAGYGAPGLAGASSTSLEILAALVPDVAGRFHPAVQPRTPPVPSQAVAAALLEAFGAIADEAPLAMVVEDLHWAAPATIEFAHRLAREAKGHPLLLLFTSREHSGTLETTRALRALASSSEVTEVELDPLDESDVESLLGSIAVLPPEVAGCCLAQDLVEHSDGIPLYLLELLKELHDLGYLVIEDGSWTLRGKMGPAESGLPLTLSGTDILRTRLQRLGGQLLEVLVALAVSARETPLDTLANIAGLELRECTEAVATLERRRLVGRRDGLPAVSHDEIAATALQLAPGALVARTHERAAAAAARLAERGRASEWIVAAMHAVAWGDAEHASVWSARAAREAERVSGREAGRDVLQRVIGAAPVAVRPLLEQPLARVLNRSWSARRWLDERDGGARRRRVRTVIAAGILGLAGVAALAALLRTAAAPAPLGGGFLALSGDMYGNGGGVIALRIDSQFEAREAPVESLPPGLRAGFSLALVRPDQRVAAYPCALPGVDPTLTCERDLVTGRTAILARYRGDAHLTSWLPDGSGFLMTGGYVVRGGDYARALLLADSSGRILDTLSRGDVDYDAAAVAPSGDRLLAWRVGQDTSRMLMLSLDGTIQGELGWCKLAAVWSPRESRVACTGDNTSEIVLGEARPGSTPVRYSLPAVVMSWAWSADGRYLGVTTTGPAPSLYVLDGRGLGEERLVQRLKRPMLVLGWSPASPPQPPRRIEVRPPRVPLVPGATLALSAVPRDAEGDPLPIPRFLHWSSRDPAIARVDSEGVVVADRPGVTRVRASTGLFVQGEAEVRVESVLPRLILQEHFDRGLDTTVWKPFGFPAPEVLPGAGRNGTSGFWNHGDYSHSSGVVSRQVLDLSHGLTVEYWAKVPFSGPLWQDITVALYGAPADSFHLTRGSPSPGSAPIISATGPLVDRRRFIASLSTPGGVGAGVALPQPLRDGQWHRYRLAIYPSGEVRWFADGVELVAAAADLSRLPRATLSIEGHSVNTRVMVDDLTVWEGVVLDPVEPVASPTRRMSKGRVPE